MKKKRKFQVNYPRKSPHGNFHKLPLIMSVLDFFFVLYFLWCFSLHICLLLLVKYIYSPYNYYTLNCLKRYKKTCLFFIIHILYFLEIILFLKNSFSILVDLGTGDWRRFACQGFLLELLHCSKVSLYII